MKEILLFILPIIILWQYLRIRHWKSYFNQAVEINTKYAEEISAKTNEIKSLIDQIKKTLNIKN